MGYFSNGTEGMDYESRYCDRCVHQNGPDGKSGCAIWLAHMLRNYDECNEPDSVLHLLIPRDKKGGNGQCQLFMVSRKEKDATLKQVEKERDYYKRNCELWQAQALHRGTRGQP